MKMTQEQFDALVALIREYSGDSRIDVLRLVENRAYAILVGEQSASPATPTPLQPAKEIGAVTHVYDNGEFTVRMHATNAVSFVARSDEGETETGVFMPDAPNVWVIGLLVRNLVDTVQRLDRMIQAQAQGEHERAQMHRRAMRAEARLHSIAEAIHGIAPDAS